MKSWFQFQKFSTKVLLLMLVVSIIPVFSMAYISYHVFEQSLKESAQRRVVSVSEKKVTQVNSYIEERLLDIELLARRPGVIEAMETIERAYLFGTGSAVYRQAARSYMKEFQEYLEKTNYYDFFLISPDGKVIFTVKHESDFGTNLNTGPYRNTGLAEVYRGALNRSGQNISSFDYYAPSKEQAAFIGAPLVHKERVIGIAALQVDILDFLAVMGDRGGLESGGEILLGKIIDATLHYLDPDAFDPQSDVFHQGGQVIKVKNGEKPDFAIWKAAAGESGRGILSGVDDTDKVSSWRFLETLRIGMVVQVPVDIALADVEALKQSTLLIAAGAFLAIAFIGRFFSRRVTRSIEILTDATTEIAKGNLELSVEVSGKDEIACMAGSFNDMVFQLRTTVNELRDVNESLRGREQELKNTKNTLEQRVKDRTSEVIRSKEKLQSILNNTTSIIYIKDVEGHYTMVNRQFLEIFHLEPGQIIGHSDHEIFPKEIADHFQENDLKALQHKEPLEFEERAPQDDEIHHYISVKFALYEEREEGKKGEPYGICGISTDITELKRNEEKLKLAGSVFENVQEAIVITDQENKVVDINPFYTILTGFTKEEVYGKSPAMAKSGRHDKAFYQAMWDSINTKGIWSGEIWDRRKNGEIYPQWLNISALTGKEGEVTNYVGIFSDISEQKATQKKLQDMAYFDPLTGLPNRHLFRDRLNGEMHRSHRTGTRCSVFFIDLDRFKYINDAMGHAAGDDLLVQVAERLRRGLRETDTVSRLGGDEFTIILSSIESEDHAAHVAHNIIDALEKKFIIKEQEIFISGSIGISIYPDDGDDFDELTKNADTAMYRAKESGRGNYKFFTPEMNFRSLERIELEKEIRLALEKEEFTLHYQPKVNIKTGRLVGYEALIRWYHPGKDKMISPADFIPLAEENKLIIPIGEWVILQAALDIGKLSPENLRVSINLSATQFHDPKIVERLGATLKRTGVAPESLELEITESAVMNDPDQAMRVLSQIKNMGIQIAMDDFGTGYSSLSYLKKFPINTLKIDQSFVRDIPHDAEDIAIVKGIISLANSLGLQIVAEGVETKEQAKFLVENGCSVAQGYLFGKPLSLEKLLQAQAG